MKRPRALIHAAWGYYAKYATGVLLRATINCGGHNRPWVVIKESRGWVRVWSNNAIVTCLACHAAGIAADWGVQIDCEPMFVRET